MAKILKGEFGREKPVSSGGIEPDKPIPSYRLKLAVPFSDPLIWRTLEVPGRMTLADLHRVIQVCMGWQDEDSHQFLVGKIFYQPGFGIENYRRKPEYDEAAFELHQLEEGMQFLFSYLYDGGDGWELQIALEEILAPKGADGYPVLIDGANNCPPEEAGDIHQYQALLAALDQGGADVEHIRLDFEQTRDFNPFFCDRDGINKHLKRLNIRR
ncbi:MAG: plasmid pRiA4b ORF-3 family protein [Desulfofustis sp.]|jgi:hypothetical protein|nr:plasmid pRiA4b ORF-3 family protein [Desulfofustis sp.]